MEVKVDPRKIRELRLNKSWSQEELADKAALSLRTVQRMELDGSASLKSRRAVADALEVEPAVLDTQFADQLGEFNERDPQAGNTTGRGFWSDLFAYPGPTTIPRKVRTPLLVTCWAGMMISGGLCILMLVILGFVSVFYPAQIQNDMLVASLPLLVVFVIWLGLYQFFKRFSSPSSN